MDKKTIILLVSAIILLLSGVGAAVYFLYSGVPEGKSGTDSVNLAEDGRGGLLAAVPADAVAVIRFDEMQTLVSVLAGKESAVGFMGSGAFADFLADVDRKVKARELPSMKNAGSVLSYHYDGGLVPLLVLDAARAGSTLSEDYFTLRSLAESHGLFSLGLDCSRLAGKGFWLEKRNILLISASDVILKSAERHVSQGISVLDQNGFGEAFLSVQGGRGQFLVSNGNISKLVSGILNREYRKYSDFLRRISSWTAFSFDGISLEHLDMSGIAICGSGNEEFMNVFESTTASSSAVTGILPSYTAVAYALPIADAASSIAAYGRFADTKMGQAKYDAALAALRKNTGVDPEKWAEQIDLKEVAVASFYLGDSFETVLLLRTGKPDLKVVFPGAEETPSMKNYVPGSGDFAYRGFASALFGSLFSAGDETKFTFIDGWIIAGSPAAVEEYAGGKALETRLSEYMDRAGLAGRTDGRNLHFFAYMSLTEDARLIDRVFRKQYADSLKSSFGSVAFAPAVMTVGAVKGVNALSFTLDRAEAAGYKTSASVRELTVEVPKGPYSVKNSGTGKQNTFCQNDNMSLSLKDENGKGMWSAEFKTPLCGRASTIDYFANGKLQILFASGSKLYLIDRLGRFVKPFPVELGKEILLGPDAYDFNSSRKYNVMILHKDNTIEMYNLQGKKPSGWKGISCKETIIGLPEMLKVSGKTFWAVRTSLQTLIYPFYGGEPLTVFEGGRMIRPDSQLTPSDKGVEVTRHDGKKTVIELK